MIDSLSIVTFISNKEKFSEELFTLYRKLLPAFKFVEFIVFSDTEVLSLQQIDGKNVRQVISAGSTKYKRIISSLEISRAENILYIDNDISPNVEQLLLFLRNLENNTDLAFGRIAINNPQTFVEKLIFLDKILSHSFIRPLLWSMGLGISIPGQIFMIKKNNFFRDLNFSIDTVFDDLFLGICAKQNNYHVTRSQLILGYEKPSKNFSVLLRQRIRWARGYYESLVCNIKAKVFPLIIVHGIAYHFVSVILIIALLLQSRHSVEFALGIYLLICLLLADFKWSMVPYAISYFIVFTIIHFIWFISLMKNFVFSLKRVKRLFHPTLGFAEWKIRWRGKK